ncbi:putative NADH dehydrogenase [Tieghemostelium lacteum]|uniref:Putative NADH dehydrogenase n=1 Tax=Tieghemostelium lacteum TaxID=361077 RepID=A0A151Z888_TIELA|nr:putative NADH dehydrogenase [Tieghemostelium lacteum]|eukprot:KYQ90186.1 putative NADH dehydrogenase [Tieghemostelium lacteum]
MIDFQRLYREEKKKQLEQQKHLENIQNDQKKLEITKTNTNIGMINEIGKKDIEFMNLDKVKFDVFKVGSIASVYYIRDFIDSITERDILDKVYHQDNQNNWTQLKKRRLQNWGGNPIPSGMIEQLIPDWLDTICHKIYDYGVFPQKPNHVLLNEYQYDQGIMPHKDGPLFYPLVSILSLSSGCIMDFYKDLKEPPVQQLYLEPRSLLLFSDDAYTTSFHGIREVLSDQITEKVVNQNDHLKLGQEIDREIRVSLTIRIVPNAIKLNK